MTDLSFSQLRTSSLRQNGSYDVTDSLTQFKALTANIVFYVLSTSNVCRSLSVAQMSTSSC